MPTLRIWVFGLEDYESREVEEMLESVPDVDEVDTRLPGHGMRPGVIYASAQHFTYVVHIGEVIAGSVLADLSKEMVKDVYAIAKARIRLRLDRWRTERNTEAKRERIRFFLNEEGEMLNDETHS